MIRLDHIRRFRVLTVDTSEKVDAPVHIERRAPLLRVSDADSGHDLAILSLN